ncbi:FAS1-like dehydratase domain-containing protein [Trujillonella endophytica]|uniref:N-terminal half of MaoC dehydratase n=1 Tax=Trujillonella endophytica TaxID=673521 RepID=A0A1H8SWM2_9ACTN|nr:MaoC family dehydratase N-terminal domain-containing protein [Trujillella endophytica]SEO82738.1 N-terminal half of MaoC dehydratase [Trujillella endophytica]
MTELGLVRPDMAALVGQPYGAAVSYPVTASDIRRWAIAVHFPEPPPAQYLDPEAEAQGRLVAPLDLDVFAWGAARTEPTGREIAVDPVLEMYGAMEHHLGVAPPDLPHGLHGGASVDYTGVRIRPGDVIATATVIERYLEKTGRVGAMLITDLATTWTNQAGETVKVARMSQIRY